MNPALLFDFTVDKENKCIRIAREFAANVPQVWAAWTTPEILEQWWAPKPYIAKTVSMNFTDGGTWHYYMESPQGERHYCRADYQQVITEQSFKGLDAFCDEHGNINTSFPRTQWNVGFQKMGEHTMVNIVNYFEKLEDIEQIISLGFKEGFTMALQNLDQYIEARFKLHKENKTTRTARVCTYLNFDGKTEEAFLFYKSVFNTEFSGKGIQRLGDVPSDHNHPPLADVVKNMILHIELPITGGHVLMGTDAPKEMGFKVVSGNNTHISIEPETKEEAERLYHALSVNGEIEIPIQDMFFGAYFAGFKDQYGINWMINYTY